MFKQKFQRGNQMVDVQTKVFQQQAAPAGSTDTSKSVNNVVSGDNQYKSNDYKPKEKPTNCGAPRITKYGWVAFCTICGKDGQPAQLPHLANIDCDCKDI